MSEPSLRTCAAHGVETRVECVTCGAPICLRCQVEADRGLECLSCAAREAARPEPTQVSAAPLWRAHPTLVVILGVAFLASSAVAFRAAVSSGRRPAVAAFGHWEPGPELTALRGATVAVKLADGRILALGGGIGGIPLPGSEIYDPAVDRWSRSGDLHQARRGHAAVGLQDGRVLTAGGLAGDEVLASAEIYQPGMGTWTPAEPLHEARFSPTLTLLGDGRVLAAGGTGSDGRSLSSGEVFDPRSGTWTRIATGMTAARSDAAATSLRDGRILIAGGIDVTAAGSTVLGSAELFDPVADVFTRTGSLGEARQDLSVTRLPDGKVLAAGGSTDEYGLASAELYDPARGTWTPTGQMATPRRFHGASVLADGKVLVSAGETLRQGTRTSLATSEVFDPVSGRWREGGAMSCPRRAAAQVTLDDGTVLVAGGDVAIPGQPSTAQTCTERFLPSGRPPGGPNS